MIRPLIEPAFLVVGGLVLLALIVVGAVGSPRGERLGWFLRALMVLLLVAIGLRPGIGTTPAETRPSDLEILVAVDRTTSMSARDWNGARPRLQGVRRDVAELATALPSARFTLVTFGDLVRTRLPSTNDVTLLRETMSSIKREEALDGTGSRVDRPLPDLVSQLERLREEHPERRRVLVLLTDGEHTRPLPQRSFAPLEPLVDAGVVLGYGTRDGGRMPLDEAHPRAGWVQDPDTGADALSRIDITNLRKVADEVGIGFAHRTSPGGLTDIAAAWGQSFVDTSEKDDQEVPAKVELSWMLALALLLLALVELRGHWRRFFQARRELA